MRSCGRIPARNDEAVFVEEDDEEPDREQRHPGDLGHVESPGDVGHVVEDYVGQGRVLSSYTSLYDIHKIGSMGLS